MNTEPKSQTYTIDVARLSLLAAQLAQAIPSTRQGAVLIELVGDLGGGKTTFVKALAISLGIDKTVTSPTFTIHQRYEIPNCSGYLEHFDLYRLEDDDLVLSEIDDALANPESIVCIEWAQHFGSLNNRDRLKVEFEYIDELHRKLILTAVGTPYQKLLEQVT